MPPRPERAAHGEEGTASVELIAVVPFLLLALLVAAQIALAGQALWSASVAARAAARAALVGGGPAAAARIGRRGCLCGRQVGAAGLDEEGGAGRRRERSLGAGRDTAPDPVAAGGASGRAEWPGGRR